MLKLDEYTPIVGGVIIEDLRIIAGRLKGKVIQHVNSTSFGGGVAEILNRIVPLLNELGVTTRWDIIQGNERFFEVTKKIHNTLHGRQENITGKDFDVFNETSRLNIKAMDIRGDIVFIHDPQPIALIEKRKGNKWIWRCHIDVSDPERTVWRFLRKYIARYDALVYSAPAFAQKSGVRQFLIPPSIDPLSDKNRELPQETINGVLYRYGIDRNKPMIVQVSRYDYLKDPVGVIEAYRLVKRYNDCQLVLAGNKADDDPESEEVLGKVREHAGGDPDIHILVIPPETNDIDINALQRAATVALQKSIREGFGLVVAEALWKAKPMVASAVGGIPLQIKHKYSGLLCHSVEGAAFWIKQLLNSPNYAKKLGDNAKENIRNNFLLTRHLKDYMLLFLSMYNPEGVVYLGEGGKK